MNSTQNVVVIGGGPAGMMAAGTAAESGAHVLLIEKNPTLGIKLLISGGGRCNLTNAEMDTRKLLEKYGIAGKFLFSAFSQWDVYDTLDFFHKRGVETKIENELRVFPVSNKAQSVWDALNCYMKEGNVTIMTDSQVRNFELSNADSINAVRLTNGELIHGSSFILATGGKSRPETGSTGDGFKWLKKLGHNVIDTAPALVPITLSDAWIKNLQGISLPMVKFAIFQNDVRQSVCRGKLLFTHFGISGPGVLNMSNEIQEYLEYGAVTIVADVLPTLDHKQINTAILQVFQGDINKKFKNIATELLPSALVQTLGKLAGIDPETPCHSIG
ncbi:MAG: aminoacetone oxidase family FAD-binding enzyme, partial [Candidatus Azambacteria bacterium]|nr:aminoacetone oxidase family FAD-binding enzyme [Candidatus Azambacteria bacterium]